MSPGEITAEDRLVRAAATQLYAGAPAEFIATRTTLVKAAKAEGEKDAAARIGALRRPSVAAWALNQLVHRGDPVIDDLADLGVRLRQATSALDAAAIAGLRGRRDEVLGALVTAAGSIAADEGQKLTAAVEAEVRDTGIAALADEAAEAVLRSGTLTRALSYSGFGEVDLSEATATTSTGVVLTSLRGGRRKRSATDEGEPEAATDSEPEHEETDEGEPEDQQPAEEVAETPHELDEQHEQPGEDEDLDVEGEQPDEDKDAAAQAAQEERERRLAEARAAVDRATTETRRHRASVEAARNRSDATRQRVQKLQTQLETARAEDDLALEKLSEAVTAATRAEADLVAAREALGELERPQA